MMDRVRRLEGYVYVCVSEQVCDLVYRPAMESESDTGFMMIVGRGKW
jgi:hypothetical protein